MEEWRDIEGYEGLYQVSSLGRIKSLDRYDSRGNHIKGKLLSPSITKKGYLRVGLWKNGEGKLYQIHRLVAEAFIDNPNDLPQVNHINEIKNDNRVENLEWCTNDYNHNYGTRNKRVGEKLKGKYLGNKSSTSKKIMCINTGEVFGSIREAEREYDIPHQNIIACCKGRCKSAGKHPITGEKLVWKYV